ncbi:divalent-cation tolerance protein CutA [Streptomyces sp. UNOC14_S4]|uniref:divalent-cation tolerance protein CutA n=1 Tax=Streptomyces sp. UNOC14_S4 TaxID=2872340 RepID=UPI001E3FDC24|nr:divalent-cation tolerance protein CutA [Streptomyces sp. UNOC14_S4]MCC3771065.1 divalent-cation tolerance protein CutA [Streptomyces sp. UNOC14_S4]
MTLPEYAVVTTTTDTEKKARALATELVGERLAACAQVYPISSVYRWEGKVEQGEEWRLDLKTRADLVEPLSARITALHGYDTPEIIAVPVTAGGEAYLKWVAEETQSK